MEEDLKLVDFAASLPKERVNVTDRLLSAMGNLVQAYKDLQKENEKKTKRLSRQFKLLQKSDKEKEELRKSLELTDKIMQLMVKDMRIEGMLSNMKYETIIEYYKRRKDL